MSRHRVVFQHVVSGEESCHECEAHEPYIALEKARIELNPRRNGLVLLRIETIEEEAHA